MENTLRERLRNIIRKRIEQRGWPRVIVSVILLFSGGIGVFCSFLLLHGGMEIMWFRYLFSMLAGYCSFFVAIRIWMFFIQRQKIFIGADASSGGSVDISIGGFSSSSSGAESYSFSPGGGKFGGGGSEGSWGSPLKPSSSSSSGRGGFSVDLDFDELLAVIFYCCNSCAFVCCVLRYLYSSCASYRINC